MTAKAVQSAIDTIAKRQGWSRAKLRIRTLPPETLGARSGLGGEKVAVLDVYGPAPGQHRMRSWPARGLRLGGPEPACVARMLTESLVFEDEMGATA